MAIKRNSGLTLQKINKLALPFFAVLFCLRTTQLMVSTDSQTGFISSGGAGVLYALLAVVIIGVCALCYVSGDIPTDGKTRQPKLFNIAAGFFFAISIFIDGMGGLKEIFGAISGGFADMKTAAGGNIEFFAAICAPVAAVAIAVHTAANMSKRDLTGKFSFLLLFPVLWAFLRTLGFFAVTVSYIKVPQLLLSIFSVAFLMVFLFENARMSTGIGRKNSAWFFFATAIITTILCLITGIPSFIQLIVAPEAQTAYCPFALYTVAGGLYAFSSLALRMKDKNEPSEEIITENTEDIQTNEVTEN